MFYIHGGGVFGNGTRYGAKYFMDEDVVLITLEFRLGVLGGFTTGSDKYPGNLGNRDIIAALKWVQDNIESFGGDPKRVLIFGNSSGAVTVHFLVLSELGKGLFHRAILQSGTALNKENFMHDPVTSTRNFSVEVGCDAYWENERRLLDCLRGLDADEIVLSQSQATYSQFSIEPADRRDAFLTDTPWNLIQDEAGAANKVPLVVGINSKEFAHVALPYLVGETDLDANFEELFPQITGISDDENFTVARKFRQVYFGDREINNETRDAVFDLFSDKFAHSARVSGMAHRSKSNAPVYFYWMSKEVAKSYANAVRQVFPPPYGAAHADELQLLFPYDDYPEIPVDSPWFNFSETFVRIWASFAAEGRPISPTVQWDPIDLSDNGMKWFQLNDELKYVEPFADRLLLWDEYIDQLYGEDSIESTTESPVAFRLAFR